MVRPTFEDIFKGLVWCGFGCGGCEVWLRLVVDTSFWFWSWLVSARGAGLSLCAGEEKILFSDRVWSDQVRPADVA